MYSLGHIGIRSSNLKKSLDFYVGALGGEKEKEFDMPSGAHLIFVKFADFSIELIHRDDDDRTPGRNHFAISVPDIHAAVRRLNEFGFAASESAIKPMGSSALNCFLEGPDGESIELCEGSL